MTGVPDIARGNGATGMLCLVESSSAHRGAMPVPACTPLDAHLVHKRHPDQQLVQAVRHNSTDDREWIIAVRLPADFAIVSPPTAGLPALVGLEVMRQVGTVLAHEAADVPRDYAFMLATLTFAALDTADLPMTPTRPDSAHVRAQVSDLAYRKGVASGLTARGTLHYDDRQVADGAGQLRCLDATAHHAVRRHAPRLQDIPARHDSQLLLDVERDETGMHARLGWDGDDLFFFDHPLDHLPGMLPAAAALRAHQDLLGTPARSVALTCHRYGELVADITVDTHVEPDTAKTTTILTQTGHLVADVRCAS